MARLNIERQNKLEPVRIEYALKELEKVGVTEIEATDKALKFTFKDCNITLYPYSGWFSGKGVQSGRGIKELIDKLKRL